MDNCIVVQANDKSIEKLMSYNQKYGVKVRIMLKGEFYCDICISEKLLYKALYEAYKKGAGINFNNFENNARLQYYKDLKGVGYLSEHTMKELIKFKLDTGNYLSISELKERQKQLGSELERGYNKATYDEFTRINGIVNDIKRAQLEHKYDIKSEKTIRSYELQHSI